MTGAGDATIMLGLTEAVLDGWVVDLDLDRDTLTAAGHSAAAMGQGNVAFIAPEVG